MTGWHLKRTPGPPATAVLAATLLALVLVALVPVALLAAVAMMALGHLAGGLALAGGSVLAAGLAVAVAGASGLRHLRKLAAEPRFPLVRLDDRQHTGVEEPGGGGYTNVVQLDRSEYTEVR